MKNLLQLKTGPIGRRIDNTKLTFLYLGKNK